MDSVIEICTDIFVSCSLLDNSLTPFIPELCFYYKLVLALAPLSNRWCNFKNTAFLVKWGQIIPVMSCSQSIGSEACTKVDSTNCETQEKPGWSVSHHIYFSHFWCCLLLPVATRGRHVSVQKGLHHWALSHMPARVVYLSAAAAVEDSGICVARAVWSFYVLQQWTRCVYTSHTQCSAAERKASWLFTLYACLRCMHASVFMWDWVMPCRLQHTTPHPSTSAVNGLSHCQAAGLHKPCWMCCCTTTSCGLQDSKQLTSLLPWHASARTGTGRWGWGGL